MTRLAFLIAVLLVVALGALRVIPLRTAFVILGVLGLGVLLAVLITGGL